MLHSKTHKLLLALIALALVFFVSSCDNSTGVEEPELNVQKAEDVPANADAGRGDPPDFTFYNLSEGDIVADEDSASTNWSLAFSGTSVLTNSGSSGPGQGGAVILNVPFEEVDTAPSEGYNVDSDEQLAISSSWYEYTGNNEPKHAILTQPNTTIVVRTANGNYAKVEILSYYKGNPDTSTDEFANMETRPPSRHYTFRYVIQTDGSRDLSTN